MANNFGLNDSLQYYEIELDSLDTQQAAQASASSTDWPLFTLGGKEPLRNIAAIKILEAQIPFSWYVFNQGNQSFQFNEYGFAPTTVFLNVGNYTAPQIATNLASALSVASLFYGHAYTYSAVYDTPTQKFIISDNSTVANQPFTFTFGAPTNSGNTNPRLYIGFPGGSTSSQGFASTGPYIGNIMTAPNAALVTGPNYLYVNSSKIGQLANLYLPKGAFNLGGGNTGPQIAKIPVNVEPGGVIYWQDPDPQKWFDVENLQQLDQLDFYLTLGNTTTQIPLQLNGISFSLKLGILLNKMDHDDLAGLPDRVVRRIRRA